LLLVRESYSFQRRLYPSLQIFGGGMLVMSFLNQVGIDSTTASLVASAVLALIGITGIVLALKWLEQDQRAARWCFAFWTVQVLMFASPAASYTFFCGAAFPVAFELWHAAVSAPRLGVEFVARIDREGPASYVGVNLIALAASRFFLAEWRNPASRESSVAAKAKP
jgi:hypothetical protein